MSSRLRPAAALALVALPLAFASCGNPAAAPTAPAPTATSARATPLPNSGNESPVADATATPVAPEDASCENMLSPDVLDEFTAKGWTYREEPFVVDDLTLDRGLVCTWADYSGATGILAVFGWAPATAAQLTQVTDDLESTGWTREEDALGVFITQDPSEAPTVDEDGYGQTYQVGEDWITMSDTKSGLMLIDRPGS